MKSWITLFAWTVGLFFGEIAMASDGYENLEPWVSKIQAKMPEKWKIVEKKLAKFLSGIMRI
jgi:hypothetical protein